MNEEVIVPIDGNNINLTEEKKKAFNSLKELLEVKIPRADSLSAYYRLIQEMIYEINIIYENIACKNGCSMCCKFYGSPHIYVFEWENIKRYFEQKFSENDIKRVQRKFMDSIVSLKEMLETDIAGNDKTSGSMVIPIFNLNECPFLYKNMCSIYEVRPLICRAFGNSAIIRQNKIPLTCMEELERWKVENNNELLLPYFAYLQKYIKKAVNDKNNSEFFTMQFWMTEYFHEY